MSNPTFDYHPVCLAYPSYTAEEYAARRDDYKANPDRTSETVVMLAQDDDGEWKIADGRHHYLICQELDYPCKFERYHKSRSELVAFVQARNANRRHSTPTQIAAALLTLHSWERGGDHGNQHTGGKTTEEDNSGKVPRGTLPTQDIATGKAGISKRTLARVSKAAKAEPELLDAMRDGKLDAKTAAKVAELEPLERKKVARAKNVKKAATAALKKQHAKPAELDRPPPLETPPHPFEDLMADVTALSRKITTAMKAGTPQAKRLHAVLSVCGLVEHEAGVVIGGADPEGGGRAGGGFSFLPLRGVRAVIELAGETGPPRSEQSIKNIYLNGSGGWVPPAVVRRRQAKKSRAAAGAA